MKAIVSGICVVASAGWLRATDAADPVPKELAKFEEWRDEQRGALRAMLGIPSARVPLEAQKRGESEWDGIAIERWMFTSEAGSKVPAVLYRPVKPAGRMPAIVFTFGHGGSKSH